MSIDRDCQENLTGIDFKQAYYLLLERTKNIHEHMMKLTDKLNAVEKRMNEKEKTFYIQKTEE